MNSVLWITNPSAGSRQNKARTERLARGMKSTRHTFIFPESKEAFQSACEAARTSGVDAVFIGGGDGTVFQSLARFQNQPLAVAYLPYGTANDCASELGMTLDSKALENLVMKNQTDSIDVIRMNGLPFATVAGIGVGAVLLESYNRIRERSPFLRALCRIFKDQIYSLLSVVTILTRRDYIHEVELAASGASFENQTLPKHLKTACIFVCNQPTLGKRLRPAPLAKNTDGRFDVLILTDASRIGLLRALVDLRSSRLPKNSIQFQCESLEIKSTDGSEMLHFADGESTGVSGKLSFKIEPRSLTVFRQGHA